VCSLRIRRKRGVQGGDHLDAGAHNYFIPLGAVNEKPFLAFTPFLELLLPSDGLREGPGGTCSDAHPRYSPGGGKAGSSSVEAASE
jgi:hypothetical protein